MVILGRAMECSDELLYVCR